MPCDRNLTSNNKKTQGKSEHLRNRGCDDPVAFVERWLAIDTRGLVDKGPFVFQTRQSIQCIVYLETRCSIFDLFASYEAPFLLFASFFFVLVFLLLTPKKRKKKRKDTYKSAWMIVATFVIDNRDGGCDDNTNGNDDTHDIQNKCGQVN